MNSRIDRWGWLALFAACNLVFWVVAALAVGVTASDVVDLGVESFIREKQATLAAIQEQTPTVASKQTAKPTPVATRQPAPTEALEEQPTAAIVWPSPETPAPTTQLLPTPTVTQPSPKMAMTPYATKPPAPTPQPTRSASSESLPPPSPPPPTPTPMPPSSPLLMSDPDMDDLMHLDAEIQRSAVGRPVQLRCREPALNRELAALLAQYPDLPYKNVQVDLKRDQVVVTGDVLVLGFEVETEVLGTVVAENCAPKVKVESISIAGLLTPAFVKDQIKEMILESLSWYPTDYALCLEQIVLEEDRATVYGSRR